MKKVNVELVGVSKEVVVDYLMNNYVSYEIGNFDEYFNEKGVWEIVIGSRGYLDEIVKNDEYESFEEFWGVEDIEDEEERKEVLDMIDEFSFEEENDLDEGINVYEVVYGEENMSMFVNIV